MTDQTVRQSYQKFGPGDDHKLNKGQARLGDTWHLDEVVVTIQGERHNLRRAVAQDGDTMAILVQRHRHKKADQCFFRHLLKAQGCKSRWLFTDKLRSYDAAHRTLMPTEHHINQIYANNRAKVSHQPTRQQERAMRRFKPPRQTQLFLPLHGLTQNLFRLSRHLIQVGSYRMLRAQEFQAWSKVVCA